MSRRRRKIHAAKLLALVVEAPPSQRPARESRKLLALLDRLATERQEKGVEK